VIPLVCTVSIAGPIGDLIVSRLKRTAGVKDSSGLLPGHGGLFDRFDSMILSAPLIFFIYWMMV
jgi:phosphatidate cytidylyltransferase